jgi:hypothetical protein
MKMISKQIKKWCVGSGLAVATLFSAQSAYALTASTTSLASSALVDYQVGSTSQPQISQASNAFVVDNKVDMTMTTANITVTPGLNVTNASGAQYATYTLTNTGNTTQGYSLAVVTTDASSILTNIRIYKDDGGTANSLDATDTAYTSGSGANSGDLAAGASQKIFVLVDGTSGKANNLTATVQLVATTLVSSTTTVQTATGTGVANTDNAVDVVFADGAGAGGTDAATDGKISVSATFTTSAAALTVTKTISVIDETSAGAACTTATTSGNPKAIPGACLDISITVANAAGAATAANVYITDTANATNLTVTGQFNNGLTCASPVYGVAGNNVSCGLGSIAAGTNKVFKYRANIN